MTLFVSPGDSINSPCLRVESDSGELGDTTATRRRTHAALHSDSSQSGAIACCRRQRTGPGPAANTSAQVRTPRDRRHDRRRFPGGKRVAAVPCHTTRAPVVIACICGAERLIQSLGKFGCSTRGDRVFMSSTRRRGRADWSLG